MTAADPDGRLNGDLPAATAAEAAALVPDEAVVAVSGFGRVGYPKAVPAALADADRSPSLTVISGGSVGDELDTALVEAGHVDRRYPFVATAAAREAVNERQIAFQDRHIAGLSDDVRTGALPSPDVAVVEAVAAGEDWFVPSTSIGPTPAYVAAADAVVVEVNRAQPLALRRLHDVYRRSPPPDREPLPLRAPGGRIGSARVEVDPDALAAVVTTDRRDAPYTFRDPTPDDEAIAANLTAFLREEVVPAPGLPDRLTLQFGVGSLGNALMGALGDADLGGVELAYFGEVIQDGLLDLLDRGELEAASATSLALSRDGQERLFANVDRYAEDIVIRPSAVSNSAALVDRFGVIAVNSAVEVDLYGHANSTHVGGQRLVSGIGGSGDFTRNGLLSVVALPSTAAGGDVSRVVPMVTHPDHTEHDVDVVVTERGTADLRGLSPAERAEQILDCAAPAFEPALRSYLDEALAEPGHVPHDLDVAFSWTDLG
ncbi:MAG: acetyl-CoA hydrolase/transferase C-terminal domain-containing protein [Haloferacaceae archaeon]